VTGISFAVILIVHHTIQRADIMAQNFFGF